MPPATDPRAEPHAGQRLRTSLRFRNSTRKYSRILFQGSPVTIESWYEGQKCSPQGVAVSALVIQREREKCLARGVIVA